MLRAYCDASRTKDGVYTVAAVAFGLDRAKKAERDFARLLGKHRVCHMTDLHNRQREFAGIDDHEADRLCRGAVGIINRHASLIAAVSCKVSDIDRLAPREASVDAVDLLNVVASPYNVSTHWAMNAIGAMLGRDSGQKVEYWFERGDEFQSATRRFLNGLSASHGKPLLLSYCYGSSAFVAASDARLFEAADVVAWEWGRHVARVAANQKPRRSLAALMDGSECVIDGKPGYTSARRYANHFEGRRLERFLGKMRLVLKATTNEQVAAAASSVAWDEPSSPEPQ